MNSRGVLDVQTDVLTLQRLLYFCQGTGLLRAVLILRGQKVNRLYFTRALQQHFTETKEIIQLMDMPYISIFHPDFSQSVSSVGFEERFIAETNGTVCYLYLLVVFTL